jgi:hypothetical protein
VRNGLAVLRRRFVLRYPTRRRAPAVESPRSARMDHWVAPTAQRSHPPSGATTMQSGRRLRRARNDRRSLVARARARWGWRPYSVKSDKVRLRRVPWPSPVPWSAASLHAGRRSRRTPSPGISPLVISLPVVELQPFTGPSASRDNDSHSQTGRASHYPPNTSGPPDVTAFHPPIQGVARRPARLPPPRLPSAHAGCSAYR